MPTDDDLVALYKNARNIEGAAGVSNNRFPQKKSIVFSEKLTENNNPLPHNGKAVRQTNTTWKDIYTLEVPINHQTTA